MFKNKLSTSLVLATTSFVGSLFLNLSTAQAAIGSAELISVDSSGVHGNSGSEAPDISADGRYVVFQSAATNLVPGNTNPYGDVYVHDRQTGVTERVSVASDGTQADSGSGDYPVISGNGRYVAFYSSSTNLVDGDTNGKGDVFVHDRQTGVTERVSVASDGTQSNGGSTYSEISYDGRYVTFSSSATNLVTGDTNEANDVFIHDRQTGTTERVSVASDGTQANSASVVSSISGDGHFVAFASAATNLVAEDTNGVEDVFVHELQTGITEKVSISSNGVQGNEFSISPSISSDGRFVTFMSFASNLIPGYQGQNIYIYDRQTDSLNIVSTTPDGGQFGRPAVYPDVSGDGRFVTFFVYNYPENNIINVYIHDTQLNQTRLLSRGLNNDAADGFSWYAAISDDGQTITYRSEASNLVEGDTNGYPDVFVTKNPFISQPPIAEAGVPYTVTEGSSVSVSGAGYDPNGDSLTYSWDLDNNGSFETSGQNVQYSAVGLDGPSSHTIVLRVTDVGGLSATDSATVNIVNAVPNVSAVTAPSDPVLVNTVVNATASFSDQGVLDTHTAVWNWGDGNTSAGTINESNGTGTVTGSHSYTQAGVYEVTLNVIDKDAGSGTAIYQYISVYNPTNQGLFSAGQKFDSQYGSYYQNPEITGNVKFGLSYKYKGTIPNGVRQFTMDFKQANFNFDAKTINSLVISNGIGTLTGTGTVNGSGTYHFLVRGDENANTIRIQISDMSNNVIYDTQPGDSAITTPVTHVTGNVITH